MKKFVIRSGISLATVAVVIAGAAAFSAYEAHIVNVTATIENALSVDGGPMAFGMVFPQEYLLKEMNVKLSDSFLATSRVDDIEYVIKQKPMVKAPCNPNNGETGFLGIKVAQAVPPCIEEPGDPYALITVDDSTMPAWQYCEENLPQGAPYVYNSEDEYWKHCYIPLSNYLSKHGSNLNDTSVDAFHQAYIWGENGKSDVNPAYIAGGRLSKKDNVISDKWTIDLAVPCFKGECAQDWASFVKGKNSDATPADFILPQSVKGQTFGTQLWVEVTGISMCTVDQTHDVVSDTTNTVVETASNAVALTTIHPAWTASIPGATWIWSSNPVEPPTTIDNTKTFDKTFNVSGTVGTASLDIATDNFYTVYVNGIQVGSEQLVENNFQSGTQDNYTITNLVPGLNTIKVVARNKGLDGSTQESNPAGVLYKLTYTTSDACTQPQY